MYTSMHLYNIAFTLKLLQGMKVLWKAKPVFPLALRNHFVGSCGTRS